MTLDLGYYDKSFFNEHFYEIRGIGISFMDLLKSKGYLLMCKIRDRFDRVKKSEKYLMSLELVDKEGKRDYKGNLIQDPVVYIHFHIIVTMKFIVKQKLSDLWKSHTGLSYIVDIKSIGSQSIPKNRNGRINTYQMMRYVIKYRRSFFYIFLRS